MDDSILFACEFWKTYLRILKAIIPDWTSLLGVHDIGKLIVAGKTLIDLKNAIDDLADAVEGGDRDQTKNALRKIYKELHDNVCRYEADCRKRLRALADR